MTATTALGRPLPVASVSTPVGRTLAQVVDARREAMHALDELVRTIVDRRLLGSPAGAYRRPLERTAYDAVYASTPSAGGHWTAALRRPTFFGNAIESYTIVLHFAAEQRPAWFCVCGAREVESEDATPEALDRALAEAVRHGPERGWAPAFMPGLSL